MKQNSIYFLI